MVSPLLWYRYRGFFRGNGRGVVGFDDDIHPPFPVRKMIRTPDPSSCTFVKRPTISKHKRHVLTPAPRPGLGEHGPCDACPAMRVLRGVRGRGARGYSIFMLGAMPSRIRLCHVLWALNVLDRTISVRAVVAIIVASKPNSRLRGPSWPHPRERGGEGEGVTHSYREAEAGGSDLPSSASYFIHSFSDGRYLVFRLQMPHLGAAKRGVAHEEHDTCHVGRHTCNSFWALQPVANVLSMADPVAIGCTAYSRNQAEVACTRNRPTPIVLRQSRYRGCGVQPAQHPQLVQNSVCQYIKKNSP
jgi:hypothetical protein